MAMYPQPQKKKSPTPAGPKQNTYKPRKSSSTGSPLNKPMPVRTGGVAGPSAPTRRSKPAGGYAKNKATGYAKSPTKAKPRPGSRPGAPPVTAAQRAYAQQQTFKSGVRAIKARAKTSPASRPPPPTAAQQAMSKMQSAKTAQRMKAAGVKAKPVAATARPKNQPMPARKPPQSTRPARDIARYNIMPVKGAPKRPVKGPNKTGGIAMSTTARKAMAARKAAKPVTAAQRAYAQQMTAKNAKLAKAARAKANRPTGGPKPKRLLSVRKR